MNNTYKEHYVARVYTAICAALNINGVTDKSVLGYPLWLVVTVGLLALCVVEIGRASCRERV